MSTSTRSYAVGLPVVVTIWTDGFVSVSVDLAELGASIREDGAPIETLGTLPTPDEIDRDAATLDVWANAHALTNDGYATRS